MLIAFGAVFETPVLVVILSVAGIIDPNDLGRFRRYVIVAAFIIGAVLTPTPDILSQLMLTVPLLALYEGGVLVARIVVKLNGQPLSRKERAAADAAKAVTPST
jgi:sec-independent protein translocase protein TatC